VCAVNARAKTSVRDNDQTFTISSSSIPVFKNPDSNSDSLFFLHKGMSFKPVSSLIEGGYKWLDIGKNLFWVPAVVPKGIVNLTSKENSSAYKIIDMYGILDMPHRYAVKMVKLQGAKGVLETYEKKGDKYVLRHSYNITYRKEGQKNIYGDLKTPGGNVVRYLYRTTNSGMNGKNKDGEKFGVYKMSYPMPHDAFPYLMSGKMSIAEYNKIPAINYQGSGDDRKLYPHPHGMLGADILIHTKKYGSAGCVNLENEDMSYLYSQDLVTENDKEIIPLIIYDEDTVAPPLGQLF
jgi:hypothetical protein